VIVTVNDASARSHQFLFSMTRVTAQTQAEIPLVTFVGTQRETGEVLVEGEGAMELTATEKGGLRRMDFKEISPYLRSLAGSTLHAAFRYQKRPAEIPAVELEWVRFPQSPVLSAIAQRAVVTTLVTSEGRSLTEVKLTLKNKAQPFLKLELPAGATILSADVAGEKVKPVEGADGSRVPLLRAGFRPTDAYEISFVFLHAGAPFAKKGDADLSLPKMDVPIGQLQWEVFFPQRYRVANFAGNALAGDLLPQSYGPDVREASLSNASLLSLPVLAVGGFADRGRAGVLAGVVMDPAGAAIGNANVEVRVAATGAVLNTITDSAGGWAVANLPAGALSVMVSARGFTTFVRQMNYDPARTTVVNMPLTVGMSAESITVTAEASMLKTESASVSRSFTLNGGPQSAAPKPPPLPVTPPSVNVSNLQQRVAGVLPISVNVPRSGSSLQFVRALVLDEETTLTFKYRRQ
jgi:hypothetical protein